MPDPNFLQLLFNKLKNLGGDTAYKQNIRVIAELERRIQQAESDKIDDWNYKRFGFGDEKPESRDIYLDPKDKTNYGDFSAEATILLQNLFGPHPQSEADIQADKFNEMDPNFWDQRELYEGNTDPRLLMEKRKRII